MSFETTAEISISVPDSELRSAREQVEDALDDISVGVDIGASGLPDRDPPRRSDGGGAARAISELISLAQDRTEDLRTIRDILVRAASDGFGPTSAEPANVSPPEIESDVNPAVSLPARLRNALPAGRDDLPELPTADPPALPAGRDDLPELPTADPPALPGTGDDPPIVTDGGLTPPQRQRRRRRRLFQFARQRTDDVETIAEEIADAEFSGGAAGGGGGGGGLLPGNDLLTGTIFGRLLGGKKGGGGGILKRLKKLAPLLARGGIPGLIAGGGALIGAQQIKSDGPLADAPLGDLLGETPLSKLVSEAPLGDLLGEAPLSKLFSEAPVGDLLGETPLSKLVSEAPITDFLTQDQSPQDQSEQVQTGPGPRSPTPRQVRTQQAEQQEVTVGGDFTPVPRSATPGQVQAERDDEQQVTVGGGPTSVSQTRELEATGSASFVEQQVGSADPDPRPRSATPGQVQADLSNQQQITVNVEAQLEELTSQTVDTVEQEVDEVRDEIGQELERLRSDIEQIRQTSTRRGI